MLLICCCVHCILNINQLPKCLVLDIDVENDDRKVVLINDEIEIPL
jgi:hypothetical protein